ncbi:MAG: hypothetical protein IKQ14_01360, partial [Candidatus Methanomethylophilaceae archaeon]|nr:hypothetical protein [Candidatus Methanomethylophilaceae archaeon]
AEDFSYFENGLNEDLLLLTSSSELSPKLYAEYLREISPDQRTNERITHAYVVDLKKHINEVREMMI